MIEALIRDDVRLICLVTIRPGLDDSLKVDVFLPGEGKTLSGIMPAGGGAPQQVARAIMTVFPVSALSPGEVLSPIRQRAPDSPLDKREADLVEREKKLEQDIENFRKDKPELNERESKQEYELSPEMDFEENIKRSLDILADRRSWLMAAKKHIQGLQNLLTENEQRNEY